MACRETIQCILRELSVQYSHNVAKIAGESSLCRSVSVSYTSILYDFVAHIRDISISLRACSLRMSGFGACLGLDGGFRASLFFT